MAERSAVNASPLIYLAGADLLSLLQLVGPEIVVPRPVAEEIRGGGSMGTLGLVLLAKLRGRVSTARPALELLRASGMYLSDSVLNRALALVGE